MNSSEGFHCTQHSSVTSFRVLCRYDVKYGSSGFNPYGYKAGCGFAEADFATALLSPTAEQYLCNPTDNVLVKCNFEHSAPGFCWANPTQNGFVQATSVCISC